MLRVSGLINLIDLVHIRLAWFGFNGVYFSLFEGVLHDMGNNGWVAGAVGI